jgi:hypothetical protein
MVVVLEFGWYDIIASDFNRFLMNGSRVWGWTGGWCQLPVRIIMKNQYKLEQVLIATSIDQRFPQII